MLKIIRYLFISLSLVLPWSKFISEYELKFTSFRLAQIIKRYQISFWVWFLLKKLLINTIYQCINFHFFSNLTTLLSKSHYFFNQIRTCLANRMNRSWTVPHLITHRLYHQNRSHHLDFLYKENIKKCALILEFKD